MTVLFHHFVIAVVALLVAVAGKGSKTATKAGLAGIAQYSSGSHNTDHGSSQYDSAFGSVSILDRNESMTKRLKKSLFKNYDKAIRPVTNNSNPVFVYVDLTYMQVLNLNEKDQTLRSLVRLRLYWKDQFLTWDPEDFGGITDLWLPSNAIWIPDVVCYEETGTRDYNPRIPYLVVHFDGTVRYLEPTEFETTCHVNISHFPFDQQVCLLTFSSWTFPTSKIDLMSKRNGESVRGDVPLYFANSGEWQLDYINVTKISQSFLSVLSDTGDASGEVPTAESRFYEIESRLTVHEVAPSRVSNMHWSDVRFSFKFRRSASLYVQSMLFPAVLLTTISLLGFYLPPDSGERIGLQITILLTFMVFILTVGDMFPASTGPYLGVYFVLCMALLGLNILMTVLVLYLHYMPTNLVIKTDPKTGASHCDLSLLPMWIKSALFLSRNYNELKNFSFASKNIAEGKQEQGNTLPMQQFRKSLLNLADKYSSSDVKQRQPRIHTVSCNGETQLGNGKGHDNPYYVVEQKETNRTMSHQLTLCAIHDVIEGTNSPPEARTTQVNGVESRKQDALPSKTTKTKVSDEEGKIRMSMQQILAEELKSVSDAVSAILGDLGMQKEGVQNDRVVVEMEEKWRWVARRVDMGCMYLYIACLVIFHVGLMLALVTDV